MGIYGALQTAVSGLRAQAHAMENISGNIANSQTVGYKKIDTSFVDLIPDSALKNQVPGSVSAYSRSSNNDRGDIQAATTETFMALNGSGFFVVEPSVGDKGGTQYTRRGDFDIDKTGYLVNGAGYRLKGLTMTDGVVTGSLPEAVKIDNSFMPAKKTNSIEYQLNLPQQPITAAAKTKGSALLDPADFGGAVGTISAANSSKFVAQSISGGGITTYSSTGEPINMQVRWAKTDDTSVDPANPGAVGKDTWSMFYASDSSTTATAAWTKLGDYTFEKGALTGITAAAGTATNGTDTLTIADLKVNGASVGEISINHGAKGITQFADTAGSVTTTNIAQNGYGAGQFISVGVSDQGRIVASYTNGETKEVAQVVIANFNSANALKRGDGGVFYATTESGEAILSADGGIVGSSIEASNTDISEEFTKLIVTQQAYAANTRIVSAADSMLQETLNMLR